MGRPKGSLNQRWQEKLEAILKCDLAKEILDELPTLTPKERVDVKLKLMEFIVPKRKAVEMDAHVEVNEKQEQEQVKELAQKLVVVKSDVA